MEGADERGRVKRGRHRGEESEAGEGELIEGKEIRSPPLFRLA